MKADWEAMLREYGPQGDAVPPAIDLDGAVLCLACDKRDGDRWWPVDAMPGRWLCGGCWAAERGKDEEDPWLGWRVDLRDPYFSAMAWVEGWVARPGGALVEELLGFVIVQRLAGPGAPGYELMLGKGGHQDMPTYYAGVATRDEAITLAKRALARHHHGRAIGLPVIGLRPAKQG